jgi:hypothetical protein
MERGLGMVAVLAREDRDSGTGRSVLYGIVAGLVGGVVFVPEITRTTAATITATSIQNGIVLLGSSPDFPVCRAGVISTLWPPKGCFWTAGAAPGRRTVALAQSARFCRCLDSIWSPITSVSYVEPAQNYLMVLDCRANGPERTVCET